MALSFLKQGAEAVKATEKLKQAAVAKAEQMLAPFRFWTPIGATSHITFLDGSLGADGKLIQTNYWEHNLQLNGRYNNYFSCTQDVEPCPICEGGSVPSLMFCFTVIDHTPYTIKKGPNSGKTIRDTRKLFICKSGTLELLENIAKKRGGLTGCRFEVTRIGDKSAAVGSHFDFEEKLPLAEVKHATGEQVKPYAYGDVLVFKSANDLRAEGFGILKPLGHEDSVAYATGKQLPDDLGDQL